MKFGSMGTLDSAIISTPMDCKGGWIQGARRVAKGGNTYEKLPSTTGSGNMGAKSFQNLVPFFDMP